MANASKIDDYSLKAMIDDEVRQSFGYGDGELESARRRNEVFFLAQPKDELAPPDIDGRSKVVDTTVRNTVLGMQAPLMKTFYGSDNVFEFEETRQEDAPKAPLISAYVNHIFRKVNPGYIIAATWIREALLLKKGILKCWFDASNIEAKEEYTGQTPEQLAMLMDDPEIEVVAQTSYPDEEAEGEKARALEQAGAQLAQMELAAMQDPQAAQQYQAAAQQFAAMQAQPVPMLYDVTCKRVKTGGRVCIENVPPEEFLISRKAKSIKEAQFVAHRFRRRVFELEAAGYDVPDHLGDDLAAAGLSTERAQREQYDGYDRRDDGSHPDPSQREVWVLECYMQVDYDGDGIPEWRKVVKCGDAILANDEFDEPPFVALGAIPMPHQFFDMCPADLAIEPQKIKTSLKRAQLDNMYLQVNGRTWAVNGQVNLDDLLRSTPGGVVRVNSPQMVGRLDQGIGDMAGAMALTQYFDQENEETTGWTRQSQGGNGMQLQQTATAANIITNRADMRIEDISRYMAETGFTDLGNMILRLVTRYQKKAEMIKVGGEWVSVDPREWTNNFDLTINVGLGTGNKDQLVQHLMMLGQTQMQGAQFGITRPENLYATGVRLANALGFKEADAFFTDPTKNPPSQQQNPELVKMQAQQQMHAAEMQAKQEQAQLHAQLEVEKSRIQAEAQMQVDRERAAADAQKHAMTIQHQAELAALKAQYEAQDRAEERAFRAEQAERDRDAKIVLAQITAQQKADASLQAAEEQSNQDMTDGT